MHTCWRGRIAADQLAFSVYLRMIFVTVVNFVVLLSPTSIAVFLTSYRRVWVELFGPLSLLEVSQKLAALIPPYESDLRQNSRPAATVANPKPLTKK